MAGHHGNNQEPGAALGVMGRLSGAIVAPVAVYMLLWQVGLRLVHEFAGTAQQSTRISILSVAIPALGVLAAVVIAGRRSGALVGGGVMMLFFLYLYISSAATLEWGPPLLTLVGVGIAAVLARWCPTIGDELFDVFKR
ncbi:hypothetical protein [Kushneria marisflavi]|uniref:Uncharacterized protein n=1 Tax=Kushneria marisflavi TaxID=157779 RepID=A0A240UMG5_9GAMM|nr:hypothetical protein [Kushneria marisflavi]ART62681.1 hypothetical protein B9H00_06130 [Kushneria marisflavi]RKD83924.1 hypothetical protein C8D96_2778 [Kushneria marisflavi]